MDDVLLGIVLRRLEEFQRFIEAYPDLDIYPVSPQQAEDLGLVSLTSATAMLRR